MNKNDEMNIRDEREVPYTMMDNDIIDSMSFEKPGDKLLYLCLCRMSHFQKIYPSIGRLMLMVGVTSANTLKGQLDRLEDMGLIRVIDRGKNKYGEHYTHEYVLLKVPQDIRENNAFDDDMVKKKKKAIKKQQAEKAAKKEAKKAAKAKADKGSKTPPSKNDGPPSKNDGPPSNFDGPPSKNDGNQSRVNESRVYNQEIIIQSINKSALPGKVKTYLSNPKKIDRLIDLDISVENIEDNYLKHKDDLPDAAVYRDALDFTLRNRKITRFDNLMSKNVRTGIEYFNNHKPTAKGEGEIIPDWFGNHKEEVKQGDRSELTPEERKAATERARAAIERMTGKKAVGSHS